MSKDRLGQEVRDEPEYPKPQISSQVAQLCSLPIKWGSRGCPPNVYLRPRVVLDTQVWLPARDEVGRSYPLLKTLCLILEESAGQRLKKEQRQNKRLQEHKGWRNQRGQADMLTTLREFTTVKCGSGDPPCLGGSPLIKINSLHNNIWFELIWFHI